MLAPASRDNSGTRGRKILQAAADREEEAKSATGFCTTLPIAAIRLRTGEGRPYNFLPVPAWRNKRKTIEDKVQQL